MGYPVKVYKMRGKEKVSEHWFDSQILDLQLSTAPQGFYYKIAPTAAEASKQVAPPVSTVELEDYEVEVLIQMCKDKGIPIGNTKSKAKLIEKIKNFGSDANNNQK